MSKSTTLGQITAALTFELARTKTLAAAESRIGCVASLGLISAVETALHDLAEIRLEQLRDDLAVTLPRIAGGAPDDHEEISAEFLRDPQSWPDASDEVYFEPPHVFDYADASEWDAWTDADRWVPDFPGLTPVEVLQASRPRYEPSPEDWSDYFAALDGRLDEADHITACGFA